MTTALGFGQHRSALNVGGHHVRRELNAREVDVDGFTETAHEHRLAEAWHAFEHDVAPREKRGEDGIDDRLLADDETLDLVFDARVNVAEVFGRGVGRLEVGCCLAHEIVPSGSGVAVIGTSVRSFRLSNSFDVPMTSILVAHRGLITA